LRGDDVRIGTTTGYTREIIDEIVPGAAAQGFSPDSIVCTGDTPEGRPSPYMIYRTLPQLGVWRAKEAIKVDDTEVGIEEGINGGTWTVGVAVSGNAFGMSEAEVKALPADEFATRRHHAIEKLKAAGAHYVIDSVADLMPVVYEIDARLARGERP
jgi:phosphonoacetaldehyde hydrolase